MYHFFFIHSSKTQREKQISYIAYMWNLEKMRTDERICKAEIETRMWKTNF